MKKFRILCISCLLMIIMGACGKTVDKNIGNSEQQENDSETVESADKDLQEEEAAVTSEQDADVDANAYCEIYKQKVADFTEDTVVFSLIYVDNDDIPELAVYDAGYDIYSIYTIKDDALFCIVDSISTVEMTCFERSGTIAAFARWNGGGDEGGYSLSYYQTAKDKTFTNDTQPTLNYIYNAVYDEEGNYTGEGITNYYYMGEETDEVTFQEVMGNLGITEKSKTICTEDSLGKEEMTQLLSQ